jgi:hypothetical protein
VTGPVLGPGSLSGGRWPAVLDALVLTGGRLDHYRRALSRPDRPWVRLGPVTDGALGPGWLVRHGRTLHAGVPLADGPAAFRLDGAAWVRGGDVVPRPDDAAVTVGGRQFALADEDGSVFCYHRRDGEWERDSCLRLADPEPFVVPGPESVKLAQITGDRDATPTPWGERAPTLSGSLATAGVRGTDLGVRVDHAGRTFLLFGDTHWTRPWLATRDAIAEVLPGDPLPAVRFHGSPLKLVGRAAGWVTMREYDVPLDGFSSGGRLYGFFSSNHFRQRRVMGRSVLARAVDADPVVDPAARRRPLRFEVLCTFSDRHFVNTSVQLRPAATVPGCGTDGEVLLVWGSGPYRASELRLAVLDAAALARLAGPAPRDARALGVRYWAGAGWSDAEADAVSLFAPAALGEVSVRWVEAVGRYLMLSASAPEDPIGPAVVLRTARQPEGPWSRRIRLLDWVVTGMSLDPHTRFIRASLHDDPVGDRMFRAQADGTGAAYAPYLYDATVDGDELVLRYTLSTWNPYQVVLMRHRLQIGHLG